MSISTNYIEFYNENNKYTAKIHKDGKVLKLQNPHNVKKLLEICHKHKILLNGKNILRDNVNPVIQEFDNYFMKIKNRRKKLQVIGQILNNMTLSKENKVINKKIVAASLAAVIGISSIGIISNNKKDSKVEAPIYEQEINIEDANEYVQEINIEDANEYAIETQEINTYENNQSPEPQHVIINNLELESMMQKDAFHFSYEDRTNEKNLNNAKRYEDLFEKYGNMYGVDKNLLMAISAQENRGQHYENLNGRYATGIMQIERSANLDSTISAYNFETEKIDTIYISQEKIEDLEKNIQIGTMILRNRIEKCNYNIPLALQSYNFGSGNMAKAIAMCSDIENISKDEIKANITNPLWLNYRSFLGVGDPKYVEHIFSYIPNETKISVLTREKVPISIQIVNDAVNTYKMQ